MLQDRKSDAIGTWVCVLDHPDAHQGTAPEFPRVESADDYLSEFGRNLCERARDPPPPTLVLTRPRELTRA